MSDDVPSLSLLVQQVRQLVTGQGIMRDDMRVLTAIVMRQDNTLAALSTEVRAMRAQHSWLDDRVRVLEANP